MDRCSRGKKCVELAQSIMRTKALGGGLKAQSVLTQVLEERSRPQRSGSVDWQAASHAKELSNGVTAEFFKQRIARKTGRKKTLSRGCVEAGQRPALRRGSRFEKGRRQPSSLGAFEIELNPR